MKRRLLLAGGAVLILVVVPVVLSLPPAFPPPAVADSPFVRTGEELLRRSEGPERDVSSSTVENRDGWVILQVESAEIADGSTRILTVRPGGTIEMRDGPRGGVLFARFIEGIEPGEVEVRFSAGGRYVGIEGDGNPTRVLDAGTGRTVLRLSTWFGNMVFDGAERLFALSGDDAVLVCDLESGESLETAGRIWGVNGGRFAVTDGTRLRLLEPGPKLSEPIELRGTVTDGEPSPDGRRLALELEESAKPGLIRRILGPTEARRGVVVVDLGRARILISAEVGKWSRVAFGADGDEVRIGDELDGRWRSRVWRIEGDR